MENEHGKVQSETGIQCGNRGIARICFCVCCQSNEAGFRDRPVRPGCNPGAPADTRSHVGHRRPARAGRFEPVGKSLWKQGAAVSDPNTALQDGAPDDGGVYFGLSAEDGKSLHAAMADERQYRTYDGALAAADVLKSVHQTAHVPTPKELDQLFRNRSVGKLNGTFNTSGSYPGSAYRSSAPCIGDAAPVQWHDDGTEGYLGKDFRLPIRGRQADINPAIAQIAYL
jgi:hypothetical protein